ncbi:hypothetical protein KFL_008040010, partial [Klebsormidium nitens]
LANHHIASLECLVNFARASKAFWDSIRDSRTQQDVFHQFQDLLRPAFLAAMTPEHAHKIRFYLASLAVSLAFSTDSQTWAIDGGLLKLLAAIFQQSPLVEYSKGSQRGHSAAFRCNQVLSRLSTFEPTAQKLRAHNALEGFRPHKRKINSAEPEVHPWSQFVKLLKSAHVTAGLVFDDEAFENYKKMEEALNGRFFVPIVCSWKQCAAGREPVVEKGFRKCGRCHVARYCSKEHQKLHWANHKLHCKAEPASEESM